MQKLKYKIGDTVIIVNNHAHFIKVGSIVEICEIDGEKYEVKGESLDDCNRIIYQTVHISSIRPLTKLDKALK